MEQRQQDEMTKNVENSLYQKFKMNSHKILIEAPKEVNQSSTSVAKSKKKDFIKKYISNTGRL